MRTLRPVAAGEEISVAYTELYAPREYRRQQLEASKQFVCQVRPCAWRRACRRKASLV